MKFFGLVFVLAIFSNSLSIVNCFSGCAVPINNTIYNLCKFMNVAPFYVDDSPEGDVYFTLGSAHQKSCDEQNNVWGTYTNAVQDCVNIGASDPNYKLIDNNNPESGIVITFPVVDDQNVTQQSYQLIVNLKCDKDQNEASETKFTVDKSQAALNGQITIVLNGSSKYGCPVVSFNQLINFINKHSAAFAIIFGIAGVFLIFFGLQLFKVTVFVVAAVVGSLFVGTLFFAFTDFGTEQWILWIIFAVAIIFGLVLGSVAVKFKRFAYFAIGAGLGVVGGFILYNAILSPIVKGQYGVGPFYLTVGICAIIGGGAAFCLLQGIVIVGSSFIGSFMAVKAVASFIGGFPTETYVAQGIESFDPVVYAYLAAIIVFGCFGVYFQSKNERVPEADSITAAQGTYYKYNKA